MALVGGLTYHWTFTPYGRLDWRAAFSLRLLTFDYTFKPDPGSDFELTLPINLLYPLSMLTRTPPPSTMPTPPSNGWRRTPRSSRRTRRSSS